MSRIQGTPFIQKALSGLTDGQKTALLGLIDGGNDSPAFRSLTNPSHAITDADLGVSHVTLETKDSVRTGYLVYTEEHCVLLAYARNTQSVDMLEIDLGAREYETVPEELSILELRFELEEEKEALDVVETVQDAIDEGTITTENAFEIDLDGGTSLASTDITDDEFAMLTDPDKECKVVLLNAGYAGTDVTLRRTQLTAGVRAWFDSDTHISEHWHATAQNVGGAKKISALKQVIALNEDDPNDADDVLQTLRVGSEMYSVSSVEANPTLAGTESELLGLEVDGVKYRAKETYDTDGVDFEFNNVTGVTIDTLGKYASYVRVAGQEITFVVSFDITITDSDTIPIGSFTNLPTAIYDKLVPFSSNVIIDMQPNRAYLVEAPLTPNGLIRIRLEHINAKESDSDPDKIVDFFDFYCKEQTWRDFVVSAAELGITITMDNFAQVVSQVPVAMQNQVFANLIGDVFLPDPEINTDRVDIPQPEAIVLGQTNGIAIYTPIGCGGIHPQDNVRQFESADIYWACGSALSLTFPSMNRQTDSYFTNDTIATIERYPGKTVQGVPTTTYLRKNDAFGTIEFWLEAYSLEPNVKYHVRHVSTFLLTDNLGGVDTILANNSWEVIDEIAKAGVAGNYWSVGDTKTDLGTDGTTRTFRIVNIDAQGITFEQVNLEYPSSIWNASTNTDDDSRYNNYYISNMRNTVLPATLLKYSSALQGVITTTNVKVAKNGGYGAAVLTLTDKLFLEAEKEVFGSRENSSSSEADELSQFQWYVTHNTADDRIKQYNGTNYTWWLRSPKYNSSNYACYIARNGTSQYTWGYENQQFAPCFRIGTAQTGGLGSYVPVSTTLANNSWETIKKVCQDGQAANYWALGDTKNIAVSGVGDVPHAIVDMTADRYEYSSDNTKHSNVVFQAVPTIGDHMFNSSSNTSPNSDTAYNGWDYSQLRAKLQTGGAIFTSYDSTFTALLEQVKTMAAYSGKTNTLVYSNDLLFVPAAREVKANYTNVQSCEVNSEQTQYGYYYDNGNDGNANRIKYPYNSQSATYWWLRSPSADGADGVRVVNDSGSMSGNSANSYNGVAPCFAF